MKQDAPQTAQNTPQPPLLEVRDLSKSYPVKTGRGQNRAERRVHALRKVSFRLAPGLYGLLGPNGAGKSTLMNIITGNLDQDGGEVFWGGKNVHHLKARFLRVLGYMPQQQGLYPGFSGRRFLEYFAALKEVPKAQIAAEAERAAALVNLSGELDKRLSAYSGGMKQRLLAAQALIGDPRELMAGMAKERIVLIATHVVPDVESVADGILLLRRGELADLGSPRELIEKYAPGRSLEDVYLTVFGDEDTP